MTKSRSASLQTLTLAAVLLCAATGQVWAGSNWVVKGAGQRAYAEVRSQAPGSQLHMACEAGASLYFYPPREWSGAKLDDVALIIDGKRIVVAADPVDRGIVLSDLPGEAVGTSPTLRARMKQGRSLLITGTATHAIASTKLTFGLHGAREALTEFERRCPATAKKSGPSP